MEINIELAITKDISNKTKLYNLAIEGWNIEVMGEWNNGSLDVELKRNIKINFDNFKYSDLDLIKVSKYLTQEISIKNGNEIFAAKIKSNNFNIKVSEENGLVDEKILNNFTNDDISKIKHIINKN